MKLNIEHSRNKQRFFNNVFFIGLTSFFGGIGQDIFLPLLPLYLSNVLGFPKSFIGFTEGLVTSSASIFKIVSGYLTDKVKNRKSIVFIGYLLSLVSRPLLAIVTSPIGVFLLRLFDGIGKGVKETPKDVLIAESADKATRGQSFGIAMAIDTLGSVVGPLLLALLLFLFQGSAHKYQYIFYISAIPVIIGLFVFHFFVKETPHTKAAKTQAITKNIKLSKQYYVFLAIVILFSLGNSSDTFLILRAQNIGVALVVIPIVYALFNLTYALGSIPLGKLSDIIGREKVIMLGWILYALSYFGFGIVHTTLQVWFLFALYGVYYATAEGVVKSFIVDIVQDFQRGKALGMYNAVVGLITLPASIIAGFLWDRVNPATPFYFGSGIALISCILLFVFIRLYRQKALKI